MICCPKGRTLTFVDNDPQGGSFGLGFFTFTQIAFDHAVSELALLCFDVF